MLNLRDLPATTVDLEAVLGGPLPEVLGGTTVEAVRLLVVDGAEAAFEGRGQLLAEVSTAALRAGLGVVAVTRTDGGSAVMEALNQAAAAAGVGEARQHEVPRLTPEEADRLTSTFASLARLRDEPRAAWLLGRPGLVDLLLRAGAALDLPPGPLSEADVFAAVWGRLVRRGEVVAPGGPSPDARERALTSLARGLLLPTRPGERPDADALPSLRSDGLLIPPGPTGAWSPGGEFASDLVRDLSVARLLITEGWEVLDEAEAPRWALRAVRLACQAKLAGAGEASEDVRVQLEAVFDDLAARHGQRWGEVPLEALLTLGSAREALARAWPALQADQWARLRTLLQLALLRYSALDIGDAVVLAPLVEFTYCGEEDPGQGGRRGARETGEQVRQVVLAWLRGLVVAEAGPVPLRQRVRDRLLASEPPAHDEFAVEALAMLGPDLDGRAEEFLRDLAEHRSVRLAPAVESFGAVLAMSAHQPELLMALTEAYYIEHPDRDRFGWSALHREGVRSHRMTGGFGGPRAGWYLGPFFRLLNARPVEAIALVNGMLDHAAAVRMENLSRFEAPQASPDSPAPGLDLDLPGLGVRRCVGDAQVWSWYRGSSVGPRPCTSALLAVERFADHLVDVLGLPLRDVTALLLRECHNLAMPGLVLGLLVRHLEGADDLLDRWLVRPEIWHLEFSRAGVEGFLHAQGADPPDLHGLDRRRSTLRDIAAEMTLQAMLSGDGDRLATLAAIGDELTQRAQQLFGADDQAEDPEEVAAVRGWAAALRPENYRSGQGDDGGLVLQLEAPDEVEAELAPRLESLARGEAALRLQLRYAGSEDREAPVETLVEDLVLARDLARDPPVHGPLHAADPIAAVAAAAIVAHAKEHAHVPDDDLRWAADVLVASARHPQLGDMSTESSTYSMGADRSAAVALPAMLLPAFDEVGLPRGDIVEGLRHCATSLFDEVRAAFALGTSPVWEAPCRPALGTGACRHEVLWEAVQEGLRDCRLGDSNDEAQRPLPEPLDGPYSETLPTVETERLLVNRLVPTLVASAAAAHSSSCVAAGAGQLLEVLLDAHRRGSGHWAREGYEGYGAFDDPQRPSVVRVLVEFSVAGEAGPLTEYVRLFTSNAPALNQLLRDLALLFTYDEVLRPMLPAIWRQVMTTALDALDGGASLLGDHYWSDDAVAGLLPTPQLRPADTDPDATLRRARQGWVAPDHIGDLVARWLPVARGVPKAVDALARLASCAAPEWQATTGLIWVEDLVDGHSEAVAGKCWFLLNWLGVLRASGALDPEGAARWRRLVDALAAQGDTGAVALQRAEE